MLFYFRVMVRSETAEVSDQLEAMLYPYIVLGKSCGNVTQQSLLHAVKLEIECDVELTRFARINSTPLPLPMFRIKTGAYTRFHDTILHFLPEVLQHESFWWHQLSVWKLTRDYFMLSSLNLIILYLIGYMLFKPRQFFARKLQQTTEAKERRLKQHIGSSSSNSYPEVKSHQPPRSVDDVFTMAAAADNPSIKSTERFNYRDEDDDFGGDSQSMPIPAHHTTLRQRSPGLFY